MVDDWMQEVKEQIVVQLPNYLNLINSLQNLNALKQPIPVSILLNDETVSQRYIDWARIDAFVKFIFRNVMQYLEWG